MTNDETGLTNEQLMFRIKNAHFYEAYNEIKNKANSYLYFDLKQSMWIQEPVYRAVMSSSEKFIDTIMDEMDMDINQYKYFLVEKALSDAGIKND